jgi:hypothetical protein
MELEIVVFSKVRQAQKDKFCRISIKTLMSWSRTVVTRGQESGVGRREGTGAP